MGHFDPASADLVRFTVRGRHVQRFLGEAAQTGAKLTCISPDAQGLTACASGRDLPRLRRAARRGGWQLELTGRRGPGRLLERLLRRPGIPAGLLCFALLSAWLPGFLWCMDFGTLDADVQTALRAALADQGIREGVRLDEELLNRSREALTLEETGFGWLSLNFTGGCLFVESTDRQTAELPAAAADTILVAAAAGEILSTDVRSGFALVKPGQYVAEGQPLAAAQKADRSGNPVRQGATGSVMARVRLDCTAAQPLTAEIPILTGQHWVSREFCLLGYCWQPDETPQPEPEGDTVTRWLPLTVGRLALPASVRQTEGWERALRTVQYTPEAAAALARRSCRLDLLGRFPGAVIEQEDLETRQEEDSVVCTAHFVFVADIARSAPDPGLLPDSAGT